MSTILLAAAMIVGLLYDTIAGFLFGTGLVFALYVLAWRHASLMPISRQEARSRRLHGWIFVIAVVTLVAVAMHATAAT